MNVYTPPPVVATGLSTAADFYSLLDLSLNAGKIAPALADIRAAKDDLLATYETVKADTAENVKRGAELDAKEADIAAREEAHAAAVAGFNGQVAKREAALIEQEEHWNAVATDWRSKDIAITEREKAVAAAEEKANAAIATLTAQVAAIGRK